MTQPGMTPPEREWLRERRQRDVGERDGRSPVALGRGCYYRPGELLLDGPAQDRLGDLLASRFGARRYDEDPAHWRTTVGLPAESQRLNARLARVGAALWTLPAQPETEDLPRLVRELRGELADGDHHLDAVALNHVYFAEPIYQGGPGGAPYPIPPLAVTTATGPPAARPDLAVLDTGLPVDWQALHPHLADRLVPDLDNQNLLYAGDPGTLATLAGHGLFICGLVHRTAPDLVIDPGRVLDQTGVGDDATIAAELAETEAPVISLSLGCYTEDDAPPPGLARALANLGRDVVVVAAAGNNASDRPFYPAALKNVIAVGCFDSTGGQPRPSMFSNRGPWVDVCAPGVGLRSTYVNGTWQAHDGALTFRGWAGWAGTSFAAPLFAAEIARRLAGSGGARTARQVAWQLLAELPDSPWPELGLCYQPPVDLTR